MAPDDSTARVPLGPVGGYLIENLKELRAARRLTYKDLAERLARLGRPIPTLGLSRIEKRTRRVDVDDLVALALALGVNPTALLLPRTDNEASAVSLTTNQQVTAEEAWAWAAGQIPLPAPDDRPTLADFEKHSKPWWLNRGLVRESDLPALRRQLEDAQRQLDLIESTRGLAFPVEPDVDGRRPVAVAIVVSGDRVLVSRRVDDDPPWGFPGGEVEPGDPASETVERELKEEIAGFRIRPVRIIGRRDHPRSHRHMIYVQAVPSAGTDVQVGDRRELSAVEWVDLATVLDRMPDLYSPIREFLERQLRSAQ
jgi:ADP-ribose pyrophosphatase YjhB (NUDIX family)/transcriptional regulator with XRE-family HTH domain